MIWIRADANKEIGTGHVMRCLSIATELKDMGQQVCFLVADESAVLLLETKGQDYRVLHSDFRYMEEELEKVLEIVCTGKDTATDKSKDFFLADSYFVTDEYFRQIRNHMPVGYVDDKGVVPFELDLLINYNIFAEEALYEGQNARLILGPAYAPLRKEFRQVDYSLREQVGQVMITTGGSDKYNLAGKILEKVLEHPATSGLKYCVVSGVYNVHYEALKQIERNYENVEILSDVKDMWRLMGDSDIAITAGGSTMYELSAVGVPILCFSFVDNQEQIVQGFFQRELVCFGGDYLQQGEGMLEELVEKLTLLVENTSLRRQYSERQQSIVDGQGAGRTAAEIIKFTV